MCGSTALSPAGFRRTQMPHTWDTGKGSFAVTRRTGAHIKQEHLRPASQQTRPQAVWLQIRWPTDVPRIGCEAHLELSCCCLHSGLGRAHVPGVHRCRHCCQHGQAHIRRHSLNRNALRGRQHHARLHNRDSQAPPSALCTYRTRGGTCSTGS